MGICFSHHLHREASCVGLHLVLEAWEARGEDSSRAWINRVSTGMMLAWRRGNEQWAKGEEILSDSKDHKNELEVDRATLRLNLGCGMWDEKRCSDWSVACHSVMCGSFPR